MMYNTIEKALNKAAIEKQRYHDNLVDKTFAYCYIDKRSCEICFFELQFRTENFLHLTGLDYKNVQFDKRVNGIIRPSNANEFFFRLGTDQSLADEVSFITEDSEEKTQITYKHTQNKLDNLSQISNIAKKATYIGKFTTPTDFDLYINRNNETLALKKDDDFFVPMSSRSGNIDRFTKDKNIVLAIFSKNNTDKKYTIEYLNKSVKLSPNIKFDINMLDKFDYDSFVPDKSKLNEQQLNKLIGIYTSTLKYKLSKQLDTIAQLRSKAYLSEPEMNEYINATKIFRQSIENDETYKIAKELLTTEKEQCSSEDSIDLITEEIEKLESKFSPASGNIHIMKFESPEKKLQVNQDMSAAIPLNRNSQSLWGEIKKGVSSLISGFKRSLLPPPPPKTYRSISKPQKAAPDPPKKDSSHEKNVEKSENKPKQEARFSLSDLNSSKYTPRSHTQDKGIEHKNHIDR